MYFPQFLIGMFTTAMIVGTWVYLASGSLWRAGIWSAMTLILLQVGYFLLVVQSVYRLEREGEVGTASKKQKNLPNHPDGKRAR